MLTNQKIVGLIILIVMVQTGCSSGGSSGGGSSASCNGAVTELEGGWEFCNTSTGDYSSYTFMNNCVTVHIQDYSNNDCTGTLSFDESETYTFDLGSTVITDGGQMAREIDVHYIGGTQYDIYMIDADTFYRGLPTATNNMSSPATRPTALNFSVPYTPVP